MRTWESETYHSTRALRTRQSLSDPFLKLGLPQLINCLVPRIPKDSQGRQSSAWALALALHPTLSCQGTAVEPDTHDPPNEHISKWHSLTLQSTTARFSTNSFQSYNSGHSSDVVKPKRGVYLPLWLVPRDCRCASELPPARTEVHDICSPRVCWWYVFHHLSFVGYFVSVLRLLDFCQRLWKVVLASKSKFYKLPATSLINCFMQCMEILSYS